MGALAETRSERVLLTSAEIEEVHARSFRSGLVRICGQRGEERAAARAAQRGTSEYSPVTVGSG